MPITAPSPAQSATGDSPFYSDLRDRLLADLLRDNNTGAKLPSERELSRQYNVSNVTVARIMQELQRAGIVSRIPGKGTFLHHVPAATPRPEAEPDARGAEAAREEGRLNFLTPGRNQGPGYSASEAHIAIVTAFNEETRNDVYQWGYRAMSHIERMVQKAGGRTQIVNFLSIPVESLENWFQKMVSSGVNGVILIGGPSPQRTRAWLNGLLRTREARGLQHVAVTVLDFDQSSPRSVDAVRYDGEAGAYLATRHVLEMGHRKIAYLAPAANEYWLSERLEGFARALEWYGPECGENSRVIRASPLPADFSARGRSCWEWYGQEAASLFFEAGCFEAAVVANDQMAYELMSMARERGLQIPEELSVVGFDDLQTSREMNLTTIHPPIEDMAERATLLTLQRLKTPLSEEHMEIVLKPTLVVRSSVKRAS